MPALVAGIHVFLTSPVLPGESQVVGGRDKSGHDGGERRGVSEVAACGCNWVRFRQNEWRQPLPRRRCVEMADGELAARARAALVIFEPRQAPDDLVNR